MIFDTHAHYDDEAFDEDREELLSGMNRQGIGTIINVAADLPGIDSTLKLAEQWPFVYAALGVHPSGTGELSEQSLRELEEKARTHSVKTGGKVVAIGEIGLDYYYEGQGDPERSVQKKWFAAQMEVAKHVSLPIVIHSRDAAQDTYEMMKAAHVSEVGGVVHCYSYSKELAAEFLKMNFYIGVGGVLTFKNAKKLAEVVAYAPMDRILLETDSPYLAPVPNRGKRNSSLNLLYVVAEIARIKGLPEADVIRITEENARRLFHIPE